MSFSRLFFALAIASTVGCGDDTSNVGGTSAGGDAAGAGNQGASNQGGAGNQKKAA